MLSILANIIPEGLPNSGGILVNFGEVFKESGEAAKTKHYHNV